MTSARALAHVRKGKLRLSRAILTRKFHEARGAGVFDHRGSILSIKRLKAAEQRLCRLVVFTKRPAVIILHKFIMNRFMLAKTSRLWQVRPAVNKLLQNIFTCEQRYSGRQVNGFHTSVCRSLYEETYQKSIAKPEKFWDEVAKDIDWFKPYKQVLDDDESPFAQW